MTAVLSKLQYHASITGGFQALDFGGAGAGPWAHCYSWIDKAGNVAAFNADGSFNASITQKWIAGSGAGLTWTLAAGAELNSLASTNAIQSTVVIANGTALDRLMDVSIAISSFTSGAGQPYVGIYLYPLNQDGTTYGDGRFGSAAAGPPPSSYNSGGVIPLVASVTQAQEGTAWGISIPPGSFVIVIYNLGGGNFGSTVTLKYRTYN